MEKGTPVPTRKGVFRLGDILKARLYEKTRDGGTAIETYEGELVYCKDYARFLIDDPKEGLSYTLDFANIPEVVKAWDADLRWFTSSCGRIEFQMTLEQAQSVCHTGQCISDVKALSSMDNIKAITDKLDPETVRLVISEAYGDISDEELKDDKGNIERLLWIAGCDIDEHEPIDEEESECQEPFTHMHYAEFSEEETP